MNDMEFIILFAKVRTLNNSLVIYDEKVMKLMIPKNAVGEIIPVLFATTMAIPDSR